MFAIVLAVLFGPVLPRAVAVDVPDYLARRVVEVFDFEERVAGNFERMPRHWFNVRQQGYPAYTSDLTQLDATVTRSGEQSLRMTLNGGSAAVVLEPGAVAAVPGADYAAIVHVRTRDLKHARVRFAGWFIDQHNRRIEASVTTSPTITSEGEWSQLKLRLRGDFERAAWLILRLELLQPVEFHKSPLGPHEVYLEDVGGTVWFDDVAIYQVPRLSISTGEPTNVVRGTTPPTLQMTTRDFTGQRLLADVKVYDMVGRPMDSMQRTLDGRQDPSWRWLPKLPAFGWYWADMRVVAGESGTPLEQMTLVGRRRVGFLWLPKTRRISKAEQRQFGLIGETLPERQRRLLPAMLGQLGSGSAVVDLWRADHTLSELAAMEQTGEPVINRLLLDDRELIISMPRVPRQLAAVSHTDQNAPWAWLAAGDDWQPYLEAALVRYGQRVRLWQVGATGTSEPFFRKDIERVSQAMAEMIHQFVPYGRAVMPWSAALSTQRVPAAADDLLIRVPATTPPAAIMEHGLQWYHEHDAFRIALDPLPVGAYSHTDRAEDLALRMIHAWATRPEALYIPGLWHVPADADEGPTPDPVLGVWANLAERLAGRHVIAEMHLAEGVRCLVLEGTGGSGALVIWNESASDPNVFLDLFLGDDPYAVDIWGNTMSIDQRDGKHRLPVGTAPIIVEGIDAKLARFRAGFRFVPEMIESSHKVHDIAVELTNPWGHVMSARLRLQPPEGWQMQPMSLPVTVAAGGTLRVPVGVTFPVHETAGEKLLQAHVNIDVGRTYALDLSAPVRIGLKDIEYDATLNIVSDPRNPGRRLVEVTALITNRSDEPQSLYLHAVAPDRPRQQSIISQLPPAQTILKRFRFEGPDELSGQKVRVGVRQVEGAAMLNDALDVP